MPFLTNLDIDCILNRLLIIQDLTLLIVSISSRPINAGVSKKEKADRSRMLGFTF